MKELEPEDLSDESPVDKIISYLLGWLLEKGPKTELRGWFVEDGEKVEWTRHHKGEEEMDVLTVPGRVFRPVMARLARLLEASDPYGSVATFCIKQDGKTSRFRLFFCNEPSMDFWLFLYLYSEDPIVST